MSTDCDPVDNGSVLLVDGDPELVWSLGRQLTRAGFRVTACGDGVEALAELRRCHYDAVITDVQLSGVNGLVLLEWVTRERKNTRVLVLSGFAAPSMRALALRMGATLYLEKPVDADLILRILSSTGGRTSFSGVVDEIDLFDYVQLMILSRRQGVVEVFSSQGEMGRIYVTAGTVCHAQCGDREGEEGFFDCLAFDGGTFVSLPWLPPNRCTITRDGECLLMEAARLKDEASKAGRSAPVSLLPMARPDDDSFLTDLFAMAEGHLASDQRPVRGDLSAPSSHARPNETRSLLVSTPTANPTES